MIKNYFLITFLVLWEFHHYCADNVYVAYTQLNAILRTKYTERRCEQFRHSVENDN